jgi:hypothetical protein
MTDSTVMDLDMSLDQRISAQRASVRGRRGNNNGKAATGRGVSNSINRKSNRPSPYVCGQMCLIDDSYPHCSDWFAPMTISLANPLPQTGSGDTAASWNKIISKEGHLPLDYNLQDLPEAFEMMMSEGILVQLGSGPMTDILVVNVEINGDQVGLCRSRTWPGRLSLL